MSKLNEKQKAFADYYVESLNAYQSALKAGYSENYAKGNISKLLENERVKSYIDEIMASKQNDRIASQDEILEGLTRIARGIEEEEVVTITQLGEVVRTERTPTNKDKLKAWELLGKRYRMFTDKIEANINEVVTIIDDIGEDDE
ncbi:terminase small subunit [Romboutsia sp.]|uniref:terminase small subunit n=1 Tax=Romboutsia sp. TaxID=1965302 RepID=UPI002B700E70|nr:terminase small subunit [Romboutsia sp.]HSQ88383.1 terminase small subunit [Romboutsia sp.]